VLGRYTLWLGLTCPVIGPVGPVGLGQWLVKMWAFLSENQNISTELSALTITLSILKQKFYLVCRHKRSLLTTVANHVFSHMRHTHYMRFKSVRTVSKQSYWSLFRALNASVCQIVTWFRDVWSPCCQTIQRLSSKHWYQHYPYNPNGMM
jgi:hypothetical protein